MSHLSGRYAIVGIGETKVGKRPEASTHSLHLECIKACLDDAEIKASEVAASLPINRSTTRTVVTLCAWRTWRA